MRTDMHFNRQQYQTERAVAWYRYTPVLYRYDAMSGANITPDAAQKTSAGKTGTGGVSPYTGGIGAGLPAKNTATNEFGNTGGKQQLLHPDQLYHKKEKNVMLYHPLTKSGSGTLPKNRSVVSYSASESPFSKILNLVQQKLKWWAGLLNSFKKWMNKNN